MCKGLLLSGLLVLLVGISPANAASNEKDWTFLTFLNGHNNLDSFGAVNINEMEKIGSTKKVDVVVQWASYSAQTTKRLYVVKDSSAEVTSPVVQNMPKVDMGDYNNLIEFIRWGVQNYPAKHYFVNVWNHGGGWHLQTMLRGMGFFGTFGSDPAIITPSDISWDEISGHYITTAELGLALNEAANIMGHKVDIYGSDACLMAMPEVASEMGSSVDVFIGSEETEPGLGWPYDGILQGWNALKNATPAEVAKVHVKEYLKSYQGGTHGTSQVTQSAFDMSFLPRVEFAVTELGKNIIGLSNEGKSAARAAIISTLHYNSGENDYSDILEYVGHMEAANINGIRSDVLNQVKAAVGQFVIANGVTTKYADSHGLSIWLPNAPETYDSLVGRYVTLNFDKNTQWSKALAELMQAQ